MTTTEGDTKTTPSTHPVDRDRIDRLEDEVREIVPAMHEHTSDLHYIKASQLRLEESVKELVERENQPTNWIGIGGLMLTLATIMAGFVILVTNPLEDSLNDVIAVQVEDDKAMTDRAYMLGGFTERFKQLDIREQAIRLHISDEEEREFSTLEKTAVLQGRFEELSERVRDIDNNGSRRWNSSPPAGE